MTKPLKILAVSDKVLDSHYNPAIRKSYPEVDMLLGCGDLPFYYLDFLVSALDRRMLYVRGNHDAHRQYSSERGELTEVRGGVDIHRRVVLEKGVLVAGLEGSMRYKPGRKQQYTEGEMTLEIARMVPRLMGTRAMFGRFADILIAHSPAFGIHDEDDLTHTGFKIFLSFLRFFKPQYMLHGHIHIYDRNKQHITKFEETTIVNVYPSYFFEFEPK